MIIQDPIALSQPTEKFDFSNPPVDPITLAQKLVNVMYEYDGIGLAANQIGIGLACIAIRGWPEDIVMFNPRIVHQSKEEETMIEGCLSFPGLVVKIKRSKDIRVRFEGPNGQTFTKPFEGMTARTILHEIDHLNGVLFYNKANKFHRDQAFRKAELRKRKHA
jgi:peptide deformylase